MALHRVGFDPGLTGPLSDIRVVDLSRVVAGNALTVSLADFGADVIKIETPGRGDPLREWREGEVAVYWKLLARNKKSVTLNLRREQGRAVLKQLVGTAQVLVENYRPGVLEQMDLAPAILHDINSKLVIARLTGFGQGGPYRDRAGFGTLVEAMSGLAAKTGFADRDPVLPNLALTDMITGFYGAFATMVAVRAAAEPGARGQVIDLSLLESLMAIMSADAAIHSLTGRLPTRLGSRSDAVAPRNVYATRDGTYIAISGSTQATAERLFRAIGRPDLMGDPRYHDNASRVTNSESLDSIIGDYIKERTRMEILEEFGRADVACGPVLDAAEVKTDPQIVEHQILVEVPDDESTTGTLVSHNIAPRLSATPGVLRRSAPALGEHNDEILESLGIGASEIASLRSTGTI